MHLIFRTATMFGGTQQYSDDSAYITILSDAYITQQCSQHSAMLTILSSAFNTQQWVAICPTLKICPILRDLSDLRIAICRNAIASHYRVQKYTIFNHSFRKSIELNIKNPNGRTLKRSELVTHLLRNLPGRNRVLLICKSRCHWWLGRPYRKSSFIDFLKLDFGDFWKSTWTNRLLLIY